MTSPVSVRVLGPLELAVSGRVLPLGEPEQRAVLAALILAGGRLVPAASLAAAAWDDDPPTDYSATLQVLIANLEKSLRAAGVDAPSILSTVPPGYRLAVEPLASDYGRFVANCRTAQEYLNAYRYDEARQAFRVGLEEFSGDVLADLRGMRIADDFAAVVEEKRIEAFTALMRAEIACGRAQLILEELTAAARDHPSRESLWVQLIIALYTLGRPTDALQACQRIRANLAGTDPGPELADLELKILRQENVDPRHSFSTSATISDHTDRWWKRHIVTTTAIATAAITAIAVTAIVVTNPSEPNINTLLLDRQEIAAVMGEKDMVPFKRFDYIPEDKATVSPEKCHAIEWVAGRREYDPTKWTTMREDEMSGYDRASPPYIDEAIFRVPGADVAQDFLRTTAEAFRSCLNTDITVVEINGGDQSHSLYHDLGQNGNALSLSYDRGNPQGTCQRVVTIASNYIADIRACGDHITNEAERIASKIRSNVDGR